MAVILRGFSMRHALMVVGIVAGLVSGSAMAAANVVVADSQAALMATDVARKAVEKLQVEMKLQRERMEAIRKEVKVIEDRFQKDSTVLSDKTKDDDDDDEFNNTAKMWAKL